MKLFKICIKTLLYTLLLLVVLSFTTVAAAYYRLIYQEKSITLTSIDLKYKIYHDTTLNIGMDEISIYADKSSKCFVFSSSNVNIQHNQRPLFTMESFQAIASLATFLKSFNVPIDIDIAKPQFFFKNLPIDRNNENYQSFDWHNMFNKTHVLLNNASRQKIFFLQNLNINNAAVYYDSSVYEFDVNSTLNAQNQFSGSIIIKDQNTTSQISLTIDNKKQYINTKLQFDNFPTEIFTSLTPEKYSNKFLNDLVEGSLLSGTVEYSINNILNHNALSVNLENQSTSEAKNSIELLNFNVITDNNLHNTLIESFLLKLSNNTKLNIKGQILRLSELFSDSFKINGIITAQNIQINDLGLMWPEGVASPVRQWLIESMHNGVVKNATCELNFKNIKNISPKDILATIEFENIDLKYDKDYDQLNKLTGTASFDTHSAKINIISGELFTSKITKGTVEIVYDDKDIPLIISANTEGNGKDYLGFIGAENLQLIEAKGLDLPNIQSNLQGTVYIKIPLGHEISLASTTLDINATLKNTNVNFRDDFKLSDGDLNLFIDNKSVHVSGPAKINNQSGTIDWISNFDNNDKNNFDHKLDASLTINSGSPFEQLLNGHAKIISGKAISTIEYVSYPQNETVSSTLDLSAASFTLPDIGLVKDVNQKCLFSLNMSNNENKFWQTTKLDLISGSNINITGYGEFENDLSSVRTFNSDLKFMDNDFSIKYHNVDNQRNLVLNGTKINLRQSDFLELLKGNESNSPIKIDINLKKVEMPNDIEFSNLTSSFECANSECTKGSLDFKIGSDTYTKVTLVKKNWKLYTNDAASFLRALNVYRDIEGGELTIDLTPVDSKKTKISPVYNGKIELTNFTAIKTPVLAKLLSFSSFRGILSVLQNYRSIPFQKMQGNFIYAKDVIRINQTYFTGDFLTLSLNGTIDLNKKYINFAGQIVPPVYGVNYILSLIPFVGHELVGSDGKKGLISANYTIRGKFGDTKTTVNPMGIILPGLITNSLTGFTGFFIS